MNSCPRIILTSPYEWNPYDIKFNNSTRSFKHEINQLYDINSVRYKINDIIFNIRTINNEIRNSILVSNANVKQNISSINNNIPYEYEIEKTSDIGMNDLLIPNSFQSSKRHSDVSTETFSDKWHISIDQATKT